MKVPTIKVPKTVAMAWHSLVERLGDYVSPEFAYDIYCKSISGELDPVEAISNLEASARTVLPAKLVTAAVKRTNNFVNTNAPRAIPRLPPLQPCPHPAEIFTSVAADIGMTGWIVQSVCSCSPGGYRGLTPVVYVTSTTNVNFIMQFGFPHEYHLNLGSVIPFSRSVTLALARHSHIPTSVMVCLIDEYDPQVYTTGGTVMPETFFCGLDVHSIIILGCINVVPGSGPKTLRSITADLPDRKIPTESHYIAAALRANVAPMRETCQVLDRQKAHVDLYNALLANNLTLPDLLPTNNEEIEALLGTAGQSTFIVRQITRHWLANAVTVL